MNSRWYRMGDFYSITLCQPFLIKNVIFRNLANSIIKEISVLHYRDGKTRIVLEISPFYFENLSLACQKLFLKKEVNIIPADRTLGLITIEFNPTTLSKLFVLFNYLHERYESTECIREIKVELTQLNNFLYYQTTNETAHTKHIIPKKPFTTSYINPSRSHSFALVHLLKKYHKSNPMIINRFKKLLTQGEDTNQHDDLSGTTPIYHAVLRDDIIFLELLLCYGANPFERENGNFFISALELARKNDDSKKLDLIIASASHVERPLKQSDESQSLLKVKKIDVCSVNKEIRTLLYFENDRCFHTKLKKLSELTDNERSELYELCSNYFECSSQDDNLKLTFDNEMTGENKLIEFILDATKLIGFNAFEIIKLKDKQDHLVLHCMYSVIHPN